MSETSSYREIMRSSSIMGGAKAVNYLVSLVRVKVVAVLLGPAGVGIIGLYGSATGLLGTLTELGLRGSAVRSIAEANGRHDPEAMARAAHMLRRLCWATGFLGWAASVALAEPLSRWIFESPAHTWAFVALGPMLLMKAISGGQMGLLQGLRHIGDIARVQVASAIITSTLAIILYLWLGQRGIVPVMIVSAAVTLALSWWFARRIQVVPVHMNWQAALAEAKPLLGLGVAMMWSAVATIVVDLVTRALITRAWGVDAAGMYQAAWALSGTFAGFVLVAMGTDFYPRLTAVIADHDVACREVNEQTEIGILLTLPGLLAIVALAPWIIWALYSAAFAPAAGVLVWMVLGMFGRVLSWPLGFIQLAAGAARWFAVTEALFLGIQVGLVLWLVPRYGVVGAAWAFAGTYALYTASMLAVGHHLIGLLWSAAIWRMFGMAALLVLAAMASAVWLSEWPATGVGCVIATIGGLWCLRGLVLRLGTDHSLLHWTRRIPGAARWLGT